MLQCCSHKWTPWIKQKMFKITVLTIRLFKLHWSSQIYSTIILYQRCFVAYFLLIANSRLILLNQWKKYLSHLRTPIFTTSSRRLLAFQFDFIVFCLEDNLCCTSMFTAYLVCMGVLFHYIRGRKNFVDALKQCFKQNY